MKTKLSAQLASHFHTSADLTHDMVLLVETIRAFHVESVHWIH